MTNDHLRASSQPSFPPPRPAAVAAVTLAAGTPLVLPHAAHAHSGPPPKVAAAQRPGKIPTLPRADTTRGMRVQGISATLTGQSPRLRSDGLSTGGRAARRERGASFGR